jgi:transcriptional regulator with XRE-family HTH domain
MTIFVSTARRRELGAELRRIRESRGYNGMELAEQLQWTTTMLSRAETGKRPMTVAEVATYTGFCGVTGERQRKLLDLLDEPDDYRIKPHEGQIPDQLRSLIFHESTASYIEIFEPIFIPGITQTPEYARALLEEGGMVDSADIDHLVDIRLGRRSVLTRIDPAMVSLFVHERALRMMVGGPQIMHEQLLHLLFASGRPQCSIRVVPDAAGVRGVAPGAFQIFGYTDDSPVVYLEHETTSEFLENGRELLAYRALLNRVARVALDDAQSRSWIAQIASAYEQRAAQHDDAARRPPGLAQE